MSFTDAEKADWKAKRELPTADVVASLPDDIREHSYLVGAWVWIEYPGKPDKATIATIKALGFSWNKKRHVWQNPCGVYRKAAPYDPRDKYGVDKLDDNPAKIA
jgi:hypothetical protein